MFSYKDNVSGFPNIPKLISEETNIDIIWKPPGFEPETFNNDDVVAHLDHSTLMIRDDMSYTKARFVLAHCYAWLKLNLKIPRRFVRSHFSTNTFDRDAKRANKRAMEILMPSNLVKLVALQSSCSLDDMARLFQVSELAMHERLKQLKII